jgi:prepilin-type N-terminal cleavage/methylation domain-containing protein
MLSKIRRRSGGFTLIELMIVIAIIAILAAILVPNFIRARAQGQLTACKSNLKNIGTALEMYSTDWSGKYPTGTTVLTPNYLKTIPECPAAATNTYTSTFGSSATFNPDSYTDYYFVECTGANHLPVSVTANYPAYNGIQGLIERNP